MMKIELEALYQNGLVDKDSYLTVEMILTTNIALKWRKKMSKKLLGIDLGGTTVKFGILTSEGEVQEKWAIETNTLENGHIVPNIVESLKHRLEMYGLTRRFHWNWYGFSRAVDRENKTVTGAFNLNWAETQEVGSVIEKRTRYSICH